MTSPFYFFTRGSKWQFEGIRRLIFQRSLILVSRMGIFLHKCFIFGIILLFMVLLAFYFFSTDTYVMCYMNKIHTYIYIFYITDFSMSVFGITFVIINFTLSEHSIYLDLCVCMCVVWLAFFSMKEKNGNKWDTYSYLLFSVSVLSSYHLGA